MIFRECRIEGVYLIEPELAADERGFFARTWCRREFAERGLVAEFVQCNMSYNARRGTLRGLHYQRAPHGETKLVRATRGSAFDVIVDLRVGSPTYLAWEGCDLSADNRRQLYVPAGVAHGFLTLADDTEMLYQMSTDYQPAAADGLRWDDPRLAIDWPAPVMTMSPRDMRWPLLAGRDPGAGKFLQSWLASSGGKR